jgi:predicted CXXCH cytochrome family protein
MTVRKLALFGAIAALWLFVAAATAFADGGPHVMTTNNGTLGLKADSCAGCHRAHTATAADLLNDDQPDLCLNCHDGTKATTDVVDGVQLDSIGAVGSVAGALRGGGFEYALIDSSNAARLSYMSGTNVRNIGHVQALSTGAPITSTHGGTGGIYSGTWGDNATVWGNGAVNTGVGAGVTLECSSCHNPHGNGQYRILQTKPSLTTTSGTFTVSIANGVQVADTTTTGTHNYTIKPATDGANAGGSESNIVAGSQGDYWRYHWDPTGVLSWTLTSGGPSADQMNTGWNGVTPTNATDNGGVAPANTTGLMTAWCIQCHTRYNGYSTTVTGGVSDYTPGGTSASSLVANSADAIFMFKHGTTRIGCEQCHVAHGSNAMMTGGNSLNYTDPSGAVPPKVTVSGITSGDSRLLKVDNRGTCQMCHDPTGTVTAGTYVGPLPTPGN